MGRLDQSIVLGTEENPTPEYKSVDIVTVNHDLMNRNFTERTLRFFDIDENTDLISLKNMVEKERCKVLLYDMTKRIDPKTFEPSEEHFFLVVPEGRNIVHSYKYRVVNKYDSNWPQPNKDNKTNLLEEILNYKSDSLPAPNVDMDRVKDMLSVPDIHTNPQPKYIGTIAISEKVDA